MASIVDEQRGRVSDNDHSGPSKNASHIVPISSLPRLEDVQLVPVEECNLCGSTQREAFLTATHWSNRCQGARPYRVAICESCGLIYLTETLPRDVLELPGKHGGSLLYGMPINDKVCEWFFSVQYSKGRQVAEWVQLQTGPLKGKRVLDILSGVGGIVKAFAEQGALTEGLEPSQGLVLYS